MSKEAEDRETLDKLYAAFLAGDLEEWINFWTDESTMWEAESLPYGGTHKGRKQIRAAIDIMFSVWSDVDLDVIDTLGSDERLIMYGNFTGTGAKTGKTITFPFAEMWVFKDHKVLEVKPIYGDTVLINSVLG